MEAPSKVIPLPHIITHRGLLPSDERYPWHESTLEAFADHSVRGFGIEFDIQPCRTGQLIVSHESGLKGLTNGIDTRLFVDLAVEEISQARSPRGKIGRLEQVLEFVKQRSFSALHLKGKYQTPTVISTLATLLERFHEVHDHLLVFDCRPETARTLRERFPHLHLAPSVCHPYDKERYNSVTGETLFTIEEIKPLRDIFDWVWFDEWDTASPNGGIKRFIDTETVSSLRGEGFQIGVVSPELHATSPGLLGGEAHPDGTSLRAVTARWSQILDTYPDAMCTDYPEELRAFLAARA